MKKYCKALILMAFSVFYSMQSSAEVTVLGVRVTAVDVLATADFYKTAFGLKEVDRINLPGGSIEVMLNFGDSLEEAKTSANAQVVIMHADENAPADLTPHLIFHVSDIETTYASVIAAGGIVEREPFEYGNTGIKIAMFVDPAGNHVELIHQPK